MSDICIELNGLQFRCLIGGQSVVRKVDGHRIEIRFEGASAREMIAAVLTVMGDDPPEAWEFLPRRFKIRFEGASAREITAVLTVMGDDPPEAREFLPRRSKR